MAESDAVELDPAFIGEVISGLNEKRAAVEKELHTFGSAPKGQKDVYKECSKFHKAYAAALENPEVTSRIRKIFNSQEGLTGLVKQLPLDQRFQLMNVKSVCREADGYQGHLVSPEFGLRRLIEDAMLLVLDPVVTAVHRVHLLLVEAARMASRNACKYTDDGRFDDKRGSQFPAFERAILNQATQCLDQWRDAAIETANGLVDMEQDYVTAAFFRHAIAQRQQHLQQLEDMQQIMDGGGMRPADEDDESEDDDDDDEDDDDDDEDASETSSKDKPAARQMSSLQPQRPAATMPPKAPGDDDFKMGYLEKRIGEHSGRQNLPEGWKWQKRWFVFTDTKGMLYYFKTADDPPNYRGVIDIKQCKIEDMDSQGVVVPAGRQSPTGPSVLIKISHKDPSKPAVKKHHSIVLRAETPAEKYSWLRRLKISAEGPGAVRNLPPRPALASTAGTEAAGSKARRGAPEQPLGPSANGMERGPGGGIVMPDSNESFMDGSLGLGMAIPEEATAKLGPLPSLMGSNRTEHDEEPDTSVYDAFLEQLAEDTKQYVIAVFKTLTATVPKAIIHAQVKQSQEHLLERLISYVHNLEPTQLEHLLEEDQEVTQKRAAAQMSLQDLSASIRQLKQIEEERVRIPEDERPPKAEVPRSAIEQSGLWDLLPGGRTEQGSSSPYGQYTPRSLQGKTPFTESRMSPDVRRTTAANGVGPPRTSSTLTGAPRPTSAGAAPGAPSPLTNKPRRRPPPAPPGA